MQIWIVNHYAVPPGASGGPTRHLGLARALRDRGHNVTIVASLFDHYTRQDHRPRVAPVQVEQIDGLVYVWLATPPYVNLRGRIRNMVSFWRAVRAHLGAAGLEPADVVIGSSPHLLAAVAAQGLARRLRVPFVMEVRDIWPQSLIDLGDLGARHPAMVALRIIERRLYRTADHVVVVPPLAVEHVVASGGQRTAISVVPNGAEIGAPSPPALPPRRNGFVAIYAGTLGHANGLEVVIDAAAELERRGRSDISIRLIGAGPERERLAERAVRQGVTNASIEGPVPSTDVPGLLQEADACLLVLRDSPVFRWGISPTKLFDYFAAARPVVTSVSTPSDIVGEIGAGLSATAGDATSLADALAEMADFDPAVRADMGVRARRFVEREHSFPALAERLEGILDEVVACARERAA